MKMKYPSDPSSSEGWCEGLTAFYEALACRCVHATVLQGLETFRTRPSDGLITSHLSCIPSTYRPMSVMALQSPFEAAVEQRWRAR